MPVLPVVPSRRIIPGLSSPLCSAFSTMVFTTLSFRLPLGLLYSSFTQISVSRPEDIFFSLIIAVRPIASRTLSIIPEFTFQFICLPPVSCVSCWHVYSLPQNLLKRPIFAVLQCTKEFGIFI